MELSKSQAVQQEIRVQLLVSLLLSASFGLGRSISPLPPLLVPTNVNRAAATPAQPIPGRSLA